MNKVEAEGGGITFVYARATEFHADPAVQARMEELSRQAHDLYEKAAQARAAGEMKTALEYDRQYSEILATANKEGMRLNISYPVDDWIDPDKRNESAATFDFKLLTADGAYRRDQTLQHQQYGARLHSLDMSTHVAFRVNNVNVELSAAVMPVAVIMACPLLQLSCDA